MAEFCIYTPCDNRLYEKCSNYIVNEWDNKKCLNCIRHHNNKNAKAIVDYNKIKDNYKKGEPIYKFPY